MSAINNGVTADMNKSTQETTDLARALEQSLRGWHQSGLTHLPRPTTPPISAPPVALALSTADATKEPTPASLHAAIGGDSETNPSHTSDLPPVVHVTASGDSPLAKSKSTTPNRPKTTAKPAPKLSLKEKEKQLAQTAQQVAACRRCEELANTRTQTVFGIGNPNARVMFIGEAPGADEDATGEPFVGRAGKLLTDIIHACGWTREEIYICNILRCRPPGNRNPSSTEAANCREYLDEQIRIVNPEYIVCWGTIASQNLLGSEATIGQLRNQWLTYGTAAVLCTYHPSYLLRNPSAKKPVWEDMKSLLARMGLTPPPKQS